MISRRDALAVPAACCFCNRPILNSAFAADNDDPPKVFTGREKPTDVRLGPPKTLNDYFPFVVPKTKEAWEARRKQLREQLLVATGLWPLPEKTPLGAVIHGKIERDGYTIEKVYFASMPGHYVCGNLYRPAGGESDKPKNRPGVLFAHGHWADGRFHDAGEKAAKASVDSQAEPDMDRGRFFMQALPATLARLGFVVFHYDMIGYADSTAIPHTQGFRDAAAELRLQSFMGLQTWNSVRALDFLAGLPDVDPKSLGMTGASGGGTQTFMLAALDDRLACAFPAVMVSTAMQGGCVCENCSYLRVNTGNVEIAALFAPKPMAFSCANDWTKDFVRKGYPELEQLYKLYGAEHRVDVREWLRYGHNYNVHAREFMYFWMRSHLMAKEERVTEAPFTPVVPPKELSVFDADHPRPKDELNATKLREEMTKASDAQMAKLTPKDAESLKEFRRVVGTALRVMVNDEYPRGEEQAFSFEMFENPRFKLPGGYLGIKGLASRSSRVQDASHPIDDLKDRDPMTGKQTWYKSGDKMPFFMAWKDEPGKKGKGQVVWLHPNGKASLWQKGQWNPVAKTIIDAGYLLLAFDALWTNEQVGEKPLTVDKGFAGFTYGYNRTLLAQRIRDTLTAIYVASGREKDNPTTVHLVGWDDFGPVAILAKALAGDAVAKTAADLNQFRFEDVTKTDDPMMLPGAVKYGGMGAFLALCAPGEVLVHNQKGTDSGKLSRAAYEAAGAANKLTRNAEKLDPAKVVEWLVK